MALLGVGRWGVNLARVLSLSPRIQFKIVCDLDKTLGQSVAAQANARWTPDMSDVFADASIDAVAIATPSGMHFDHAMKAIAAGKHVFIEKPMASSVAEGRELIKAAKAKGVKLMVGHIFMYNAAVKEAKKRISSGELGDIHYVYSRRLNLGQFRRDSDVLWTLAPHDISVISHWLDEQPDRVAARGLIYAHPQLGIPEVCFAQMDFPSGRAAHMHLSWLDPQKCREMVIIGSRKMLVYDDTQPDRYIQIYDKRVETAYNDAAADLTDFQSRLRAGDLVIPAVRMTEPLVAEFDEFADAILSDREPLTNGEHGLEVVAVMEAMSESLRDNGRIVSMEQTRP
jgi:predicted dehydrogenase